MWERRHDFPRPDRGPGGHRRYTEEQVEQVQRVLAAARARAVTESCDRTGSAASDPAESVSLFCDACAGAGPSSQPQLVGKPAMIALSHAIEDECLARAENQLLFGCFQRERFFRQDQDRWRELSQQRGDHRLCRVPAARG